MSQTLVIPQHVADKLAASKESCSNCKFMHNDADGDMTCRRHPPTAWLVAEPMPPPHVGKMGFKVHSASPVVAPKHDPKKAKERWCGEGQPRSVQ